MARKHAGRTTPQRKQQSYQCEDQVTDRRTPLIVRVHNNRLTASRVGSITGRWHCCMAARTSSARTVFNTSTGSPVLTIPCAIALPVRHRRSRRPAREDALRAEGCNCLQDSASLTRMYVPPVHARPARPAPRLSAGHEMLSAMVLRRSDDSSVPAWKAFAMAPNLRLYAIMRGILSIQPELASP